MAEKLTAAYWRGRAEEARAIADGMKDQQTRASMQRVARGYDQLAERAERMEREWPKSRGSAEN